MVAASAACASVTRAGRNRTARAPRTTRRVWLPTASSAMARVAVCVASVCATRTRATLDERARIWLDINCAHCHRADGPASTSGLHLGWREMDRLKIGVEKTPVAAGRGSGNLRFGIVPGKPDESILLYRIKSNDPGVMMPELGRTQIQPEAVALIRDWISSMPH